jgi:hypothetical protein
MQRSERGDGRTEKQIVPALALTQGEDQTLTVPVVIAGVSDILFDTSAGRRQKKRGTHIKRCVMFKEYVSLYELQRAAWKTRLRRKETTRESIELTLGCSMDDVEAVYSKVLPFEEVYTVNKSRDGFLSKENVTEFSLLQAELNWYKQKRPYFNVYPVIQKKFLSLSGDVKVQELTVPYGVIEVRTAKNVMLVVQTAEFVAILTKKRAGVKFDHIQVGLLDARQTVGEALNKLQEGRVFFDAVDGVLEDAEVAEMVFLAVGTCMLAKDKSIVRPVVLNRHWRENLTPHEIAVYAEKAVSRTGRVGFEVGKELNRLPVSIHFRNGNFAKFYVGKEHAEYPDNCELDKAPIIKWRAGAVINKDKAPTVPTGFRDK